MRDFFFIKTNGDYTKVKFGKLVYIECLKNYVRIVTKKNSYIILGTMKHVEELMPTDRFCRIHRSYIISIKHINRFNGKSVTVGEKNLPISEQYRSILLKKVITLNSETKSKQDPTENGSP